LETVLNHIFIDGDAGGNSLFGGHENMVGKRISQEFSQSSTSRQTLAMITDKAMTHLKSVFIEFMDNKKS
jgi:hypothetical protein